MFKSHQIKSNHRTLRENEVCKYEAPVFAPDYSTSVLAAKMCTNTNQHCVFIIFPWAKGKSSYCRCHRQKRHKEHEFLIEQFVKLRRLTLL
jgi:hypothetical protein